MSETASEAASVSPSWARRRVVGEVPFAVDLHLALIGAYERANQAHTRHFDRWDLTPQQYNAIRILYFGDEGGVRLSEIGERLLQRVPDASRLVDRLERAGLARRAPDPDDRRAVLVELTPSGRQLLEEMDEGLMEAIDGFYSGLTPREQRRLESLLVKAISSSPESHLGD